MLKTASILSDLKKILHYVYIYLVYLGHMDLQLFILVFVLIIFVLLVVFWKKVHSQRQNIMKTIDNF